MRTTIGKGDHAVTLETSHHSNSASLATLKNGFAVWFGVEELRELAASAAAAADVIEQRPQRPETR